MRRPIGTTVLGAAVLWCAASVAYGLGLGDLQVQSGLGQPFSGTIPLYVDSPSDLNAITVGLADADAFRRAGVEASAAVEALHFVVDAKHVPPRIVVSSSRPINAPFLNFLVSARTGDGVLSREYTVLLNPANYGPQAAIASSAAPVTTAAAAPPPVAAAPAAVVPSPPLLAQARAVADDGAASHASVRTPAAAPDATSVPAMAPGVRRFGPIQPQQTLWSVAERVRPDPSITMDQVLLAIYDANPQAFSGGRFNGLMKGSVLAIPDAARMRTTTPAVAAARVRHLRAQVAAASPAAPGASTPVSVTPPQPAPGAAQKEAAAASTPAQRLAARTPAVPGSDSVPPPVSAPAGTNTAEGTSPSVSPGLQSEAGEGVQEVPAQPDADSRAPEVSAHAAPTDVQASGPTAGSPAVAAVQESGTPPQSAASIATSTEPGSPQAAHRVTLKPDRGGMAEKAPPAPAFLATLLEGLNLPLVGGVVLLGLLLGLLMLRRRQQQVTAGDAALSPQVAAGAVPGRHPGGMRIHAAEASAAAQAPAMTGHDAAAFAAELDAADADLTLGAPGPGRSHYEKVSPSAVSTVAGDGDDPLADAEFHLAYGLYDEAIPLLEKAIALQPENLELQVKLAQTYAAAGKPEAFEALAGDLKDQVSAEAWQDLAAEGRKLCPGVALFDVPVTADGTMEEPEPASDSSPVPTDPVASEDAEAATFANPDRIAPLPDETATPVGQPFTSQEPSALSTSAVEAAAQERDGPDARPATPGDNVIEFDLEPVPAAPAAPVSAGHSGDDVAALVAEGLAAADEASRGGSSAPAAGQHHPDVDAPGRLLDFDLDAFDVEIPPVPSPVVDSAADSAAVPEAKLDLGPMKFTLDEASPPQETAAPEASPSQGATPAGAELDAGLTDFPGPAPAGVAEAGVSSAPLAAEPLAASSAGAGTRAGDAPQLGEALSVDADYAGKLDLAEIYTSMGENDAAREVAREVLKSSDAQLRAAAQKLLSTLAG